MARSKPNAESETYSTEEGKNLSEINQKRVAALQNWRSLSKEEKKALKLKKAEELTEKLENSPDPKNSRVTPKMAAKRLTDFAQGLKELSAKIMTRVKIENLKESEVSAYATISSDAKLDVDLMLDAIEFL